MILRAIPLYLLTALATSQGALADTTVAETRKDNFPYAEQVRLLIDDGSFWIECRDEYLDRGRIRAKPESVRYSFEKALEWSDTNLSARVNVEKKVSSFVRYYGRESGSSSIFVRAGELCALRPENLRELLDGLDANLDAAIERDKQDLDALFN